MATQNTTCFIKKSINGGTIKYKDNKIAELQSDEVLIKVYSASLNYRDLLVLSTDDNEQSEELIPLSDAAGEIIKIGANVTEWNEGDRVAPTFFKYWNEGRYSDEYLKNAIGGGSTDGVLAEYIIVNEQSLVKIPDYLSYREAATLPCAAVTAWHALVERGNLSAEDTLLLQGTGGVSLFALQIAVAIGAKVIITSSSDDKLMRARSLGAWKTINYISQPDWDKEVLNLTKGKGASHVVELGGQETYQRSLNAVSSSGIISQIGVLTGFEPKPNLLQLQFKNASINGICVGSKQHFKKLNEFLSTHKIKPIIDREFEFNDVASAYSHLKSAQHFGKIIINFNDN